uniref:Uncharacterized protein n=1 Tax=Anguilla anguilla TaxID=7936 RepID=A0A0E9TIQ0_ANGAN
MSCCTTHQDEVKHFSEKIQSMRETGESGAS